MKRYTIIEYLLEAVENNYISKLVFNDVSEDEVSVDIYTSDRSLIRPVVFMVEANMYTRNKLKAYNVTSYRNELVINTFDNVKYTIKVRSLKGDI